MARTTLPPDAATRLRRTVAARLAAATDDRPLIEGVVELCVPWLLADTSKLWLGRAKRLRMSAAAATSIKRLARSLALMTAGEDDGQQAEKAARKALRAARTRRVDMDGLLDLAAGYRLLRTAHRKEKGSTRLFAQPEVLSLAVGAMLATRITSDRALAELGQQAGNCLGNPLYRKAYASRLRRRETAVWRIDVLDQPDTPIWVVELSSGAGTLIEYQHVGPGRTMPRDRDGLFELLAARVRPCRSWQDGLVAWSISPELIAAQQASAVERLNADFAGETWRFELGTPGVLVAVPEDGPSWVHASRLEAWMLHGARTKAPETLSVQWPGGIGSELNPWVNDDDLDPEVPCGQPAGPWTMLNLAIRSELRQACRASPALHRACLAAFSTEDPLFLEDWFGTLPPSRGTARRG